MSLIEVLEATTCTEAHELYHGYQPRIGHEPLGANLSVLLDSMGISQKELADRAKLYPTTISRILSGKTNTNIDKYCQIVRGLGLELDQASWLLSSRRVDKLLFDQAEKDSPIKLNPPIKDLIEKLSTEMKWELVLLIREGSKTEE